MSRLGAGLLVEGAFTNLSLRSLEGRSVNSLHNKYFLSKEGKPFPDEETPSPGSFSTRLLLIWEGKGRKVAAEAVIERTDSISL